MVDHCLERLCFYRTLVFLIITQPILIPFVSDG
jgi:hypothetical protein